MGVEVREMDGVLDWDVAKMAESDPRRVSRIYGGRVVRDQESP